MKKMLKRLLILTPVLAAIATWTIAFAEEITTMSLYPAWHSEPEIPKVLLDRIN